MKRGMSRKGVATGEVLLLVLGVFAVALVGYFVYKAFTKPTGVIDLLPDGKQAVALLCNGYAGSSEQFRLGYCTDFKKLKISGKDEYVNCDYLVKENAIEIDEKPENLDCSTAQQNFCNTGIPVEDKDKIKVNGELCDKGTATVCFGLGQTECNRQIRCVWDDARQLCFTSQ